MAKVSNRFHEVNREFIGRRIPTTTPGFYDHAEFLAAERVDPLFLDNYGRFVNFRSYDQSYLDRAERIIEIVAEGLHRGLILEGRLGGCMDTSMAMARILDKHGVWNYIVKGAVKITFPTSATREPFHFRPTDSDASGRQFGHKWVYAPPFVVVDVTLKLQEYVDNAPDFLPDKVLAKMSTTGKGSIDDLFSPDVVSRLRTRGRSDFQIIASAFPNFDKWTSDFPAHMFTADQTELKYIPTRVSASLEPLEQLRSYSVKGQNVIQFYEAEIKPKLDAAGH